MTGVGVRLRVVIVGGGFGGLACARALDGAPVEVLLIDPDNYHLFTPLLYQVASALLNPSEIAYPLRTVFRRSRNVRFRQGMVTEVDFGAKAVSLHDGTRLGYDVLVLATGSTNNYFRHPALARHTIGLKQLGEALRLRNHVLSCLEMAARATDPGERRAWLTFVVAGGGSTGVEYAGALGELLGLVCRMRKPFRYTDKGTMATIGRSSAVAQIGPLRFRGLPGWLAWLTVHIYYLAGFRNRLAVLWSWSWNYLGKDRPIRIIARSDTDALTGLVEGMEATARRRPPRRPGSPQARAWLQ